MKRKTTFWTKALTLLFVALFSLTEARAQAKALPYEYGFENNNLAAEGWTMEDCHESTGINDTRRRTGNYAFRFYYRNNPPQYLISPEFEGTTAMIVSFWYKTASPNLLETFQFGYSSTTNATNAFTWEEEVTATNYSEWIQYETNVPADASDSWTQVSVDLSRFAGQEGYVAFRLMDEDKDFLLIDDVTISNPLVDTWTTVNDVTNPYVLEGLTPKTDYTVEAQAVYADGQSRWKSITFTKPNAVPLRVGSALYTTFVAPSDVSFPSELTAYIVTATRETSVSMQKVSAIPAGAAVVVKAEAAGTYYLEAATSTDDTTGNLLKASDGTIQGAENIYALANQDNGVGFYPVESTVTIPAGKAYLEITVPGEAKPFYGFFEDDETAIDNLNTNVDANKTIYNLAGLRINKMQNQRSTYVKGINIINGKKVLK